MSGYEEYEDSPSNHYTETDTENEYDSRDYESESDGDSDMKDSDTDTDMKDSDIDLKNADIDVKDCGADIKNYDSDARNYDIDMKNCDIDNQEDEIEMKFKAIAMSKLTKEEKRELHNVLERRRRDQIKDRLLHLKTNILDDSKIVTRAQIVKGTTNYVALQRYKCKNRLTEIKKLKYQKRILVQQIITLQKRVGPNQELEEMFNKIIANNYSNKHKSWSIKTEQMEELHE